MFSWGKFRRDLCGRLTVVGASALLFLLTASAAWAEPVSGGGAQAAALPEPSGAPAISTSSLWRMLIDGGPLMLILAGCSFLVITFVLERFISLRRSRVIPKPFVTRFLEQLKNGELDRQQAQTLCEENGSPVAQVFTGALRKWGRPSVEVEQAAIDQGERVTHQLRKYLRIFYGVASVGPLLGLMGTVLGMIQTFNAIANHDVVGRAEMMAGGIAKALLNTAGGLAVAIPASTFYVIFLSKIERLVMDIDDASQQVVNSISAEELAERASKPAKPRRNANAKDAA
jgi:biopolymer transport protein ExbB